LKANKQKVDRNFFSLFVVSNQTKIKEKSNEKFHPNVILLPRFFCGIKVLKDITDGEEYRILLCYCYCCCGF
jgi:hypothetical protein